nr:immunoglobulin light chain junction region [Macaca mulatta]
DYYCQVFDSSAVFF